MESVTHSATGQRGPFFSLVIPAYGSARYLPKLFASLDAQTFRDFEVLFAVEESPDHSLQLCQDYAKGKDNVFVGSLRCSGAAGASRNWCYARAKGRYLVPLDGDDWFDADGLERLAVAIEKAQSPEVVIVTARVLLEAADGTISPSGMISNLPASADGAVLSGIELLRRIGRSGRHALNYAALNVVRTDFLRAHGLRQRVGLSSEDTEWVPRVWLSASRIAFLAHPYYNYRRHSGSVSNVHSPKILYSVAVILVSLMRFYEKLELPADVRRFVENDVMSIFCWYMTNDIYKNRFTDADRKDAIWIATSRDDRARFRRTLRSVSILKRIGLHLLLLGSRLRWFFPAKAYFRWIYYPLTQLKHRG